MTPLEKLHEARNLLIQVEEELLEQKGFCPYEVGFTLNKLDEAINQVKNMK